jgi:putative heme-binding domain-containing protein
MAGPTYDHDSVVKSPLRLPASYDGRVFIYDWMRNWIKTVRIDDHGKPDRIEPFLPQMTFRKPIDMKFGPDGCMYVIDYGNIWAGNTDGQILRIIYRRGNRPPLAVAKAIPEAGKQPLNVRLSARESSDKDTGDHLGFAWRLGPDKPIFSHDAEATATFDRPGTYPAEVTVIDSHGAKSSATVQIQVGNARPTITILAPHNGGFFDWGDRVRYRVELADEEDGTSQKNPALGAKIRVQGQYFVQRPGSASDQEGLLEPGLALMRQTTCFSCHSVQAITGGGPPYFDVSRKYHDQPAAREQLANKILSGGAGVWGPKPMPPHPQHTLEQTRQMADWVLSLASEGMGTAVTGAEGVIQLPAAPPAGRDAGVYVLSASYADNGAEGAPPLTGEATVVLHSRRKLAAASERRHGVELSEVFVVGPCGRFSNDGWIAFDDVDLHGIDHVDCSVGQAGIEDAVVELHASAPDGPLLGKCAVPSSKGAELVLPATIPLQPYSEESHSLFVVARTNTASNAKVATLRELKFVSSSHDSDEHRRIQKDLAKLPLSPPAAIGARAIVKAWTLDDLKPVFDRSSHGRSFDRGKSLFTSASCSACHRLKNQGESIGPDLSQSLARLNREPTPEEAILREIVKPSDVVDPKYRTVTLITSEGQSISGLIVRQNDRTVWLVSNPLALNEIKEVSRSDIEQIVESSRSLMPDGLLNTLNGDEIADLLAYIRSAGDPQNVVFH